jgi:uncharacterized protein
MLGTRQERLAEAVFPMKKHSVKAVARKAISEEKKLQDVRGKDLQAKTKKLFTGDSFQNFSASLGLGTNNLTTGSTYGFNPISRIRTLLEWIHRGSWLGGIAIDVVADDMTRAGVEITGELEPDQIQLIEEHVTGLGIWGSICDTCKWGRLYGGAIAVMLIDGQNLSTPFKVERVGKGAFKGLMVLDRWMIEPSLEDLVQEFGPNLGLPKFYRVNSEAPALYGQKIHYSRCLRMEGVRLPYWQRIMENLWGISILERLYDRMVAYDSATTGASQLVYKSYLRTYKIEKLRELIAAGGPLLEGVVKQVQFMRLTQSNEGITLLDAKDEMEAMTQASMTGIIEVLTQLGEQLSGALQIPLVRMFGQSPKGFSTGETDLRMYYDGINQQQERTLKLPVLTIYRAMAQSLGIIIPPGFGIKFRPLWQLTEVQKGEAAAKIVEAVTSAQGAALISDKSAMKELKQSSAVTGVFSNITEEEIESASEIPVPAAEPLLPGEEGETPGEGAAPPEKKASSEDAERVTKAAAEYVDKSPNQSHCGSCKFLRDSMAGTKYICAKVEGEIMLEGGCKFWKVG